MNRAFEMIYLLMQKKCMTARELAEYFEVSTRTIYRDLDELSAAGVPVYTTKGRNGGICLLENFIMDKSLLSEEEQDEILFALQSIKATNAGSAERVSKRLAGLFQKRSIDWIDIDFSHWGSLNYEKEKFLKIKQAILANQYISFTYYNADGETSIRKVEPMKLIFKGGSWYLQSYCMERKSFRTFKIMRMDELKVVNEHFEDRNESAPELPTQWAIKEEIEYQLLFKKSVSYRVHDEFPRNHIKRNEDGTLLVTTLFQKGAWITGYLLSYGDDVTVVSPISQREEIKEIATILRKKYQ